LQIFSAVSMIWNSVSCKCIHSNHQTLSACWYYSPLQTNKTKNQSKPTHKRMNAFHKSECNYDSSTYSPHNPKFDRKWQSSPPALFEEITSGHHCPHFSTFLRTNL
jgi:hypothetical protein